MMVTGGRGIVLLRRTINLRLSMRSNKDRGAIAIELSSTCCDTEDDLMWIACSSSWV
ncbi:hypothetical protein BDR03DRAFT_939174 [Suillus americanus]|nr:hypothetical protein BDR03DRAFT_939174 [Suillus americanus]